MMTTYTASVVGGGAGGRLSLNALRASDRFEVVAAADLRDDVRAKLNNEYPGIKTYRNHHEMFDNSATDIVCVSTYAPSHEVVTLDALKLNLKGILVEKPLGHTSQSGRRILSEIEARSLPMAVPHGLLAKRAPLEIIDRVRNGEIGALRLVEIQNQGWDIINAGIHWVNFFVALTANEAIESVLCACDTSARTFRDGMQVETVGVTYAITKSGVRLVMNTGDYIPVNAPGKDILFRIIGDAGQIEFWGWQNEYRILNSKHPSGDLIVVAEFPVPAHQRHLENMARMIDTGTPDYTIPRSSLLALEICEAAYLSAKRRSQVNFPFDFYSTTAGEDWAPGQPYNGVGGGRDGNKL